MKTEVIIIFAIYFGFCLAETLFSNFFSKSEQTRGDGIVEIISIVALLAITQPTVLFLSYLVCTAVIPQYAEVFGSMNVFLAFGLFLIFDDMTQYWWHRASHSIAWLYKLHRPHHNAKYMSVRLVYRNNIFYYLLMPSLWFSGILIFMGLAHVYAVFIVLKLLIITAAHSDLRWDRKLYESRFTRPIMWVLERLISTPATHHAHHGRHEVDPATHYKGNYGNMLFLWDIIFGTDKITRRYPDKFGVENLPDTTVGEQLLWPLIRSSEPVAVSDTHHINK